MSQPTYSHDEGGFYRLSDIVRTPGKQDQNTRLPISETTWYRGMKAGLYPKPVRLGGTVVWPKSVIHDLERRIAAGEMSEVPKDEPGTAA